MNTQEEQVVSEAMDFRGFNIKHIRTFLETSRLELLKVDSESSKQRLEAIKEVHTTFPTFMAKHGPDTAQELIDDAIRLGNKLLDTFASDLEYNPSHGISQMLALGMVFRTLALGCQSMKELTTFLVSTDGLKDKVGEVFTIRTLQSITGTFPFE